MRKSATGIHVDNQLGPVRHAALTVRHGAASNSLAKLKMCCRDYKEDKKEWGWVRPAPISQKQGGEPDTPKKLRKKVRNTHTLACKIS